MSTGGSVYGCAVIRAAVEEIEALAPPPNPPLTLEELREMDGEPVWVAAPDRKMFEACWMLVMVRNSFVMANWQVCDFKDYGKTWLAYRCKPKDANA